MKYNKENILTYLNQKAFSDDEYTKDEYMKELLKLQDAILDLYRVEGKFTDETGFANSRYFSTSFKQNTGMSPSQYRKEHGIKKEENKTDAT